MSEKNSGLAILGMMLILGGMVVQGAFHGTRGGYLFTGLFIGAGLVVEIGALMKFRRQRGS